jgi:membrane fusion protein (multidrug efflux system)
VLVARRDRVVLVPKDSLVQMGETFVVYVVKNGKARVRPVQIGVASDSVVEVKSGLLGSESIIISGQSSLKDGQPVKVTK